MYALRPLKLNRATAVAARKATRIDRITTTTVTIREFFA